MRAVLPGTAVGFNRLTLPGLAGLRALVDAGAMQIADPEAAAAVLVASLAYYPMVRLLIGHTPGGVDRERYSAAWIGHAQAVLRQAADAARRLQSRLRIEFRQFVGDVE